MQPPTVPPFPAPQIAVLDAGGQYCHLIARRVRELGVYAEVRPSETPAAGLAGRRGIIISGGPASVYEPSSPTVDASIFASGAAVLGICYGQQLMAHLLGGEVRKGVKGEYGLAQLEPLAASPLLGDLPAGNQIWMSHRDLVGAPPPGFRVVARTETCPVAAMEDNARRLHGVQFHPEVVHTRHGMEVLARFLFDICGCRKDWNPKLRIPLLEQSIRDVAGERNVFFFVSGGVDSTVAYTLCLRTLGAGRVRGVYVDTGLMREGETDFVRGVFAALGSSGFSVEDASERFLGALGTTIDPERKRHIIGEMFVEVQEEILQRGHYLDAQWILGQGTIYPDTIESGGTAKADVIKTHHNRVAGIQRLMAENRIVEPLSSFYKDEVREVGRELGLPEELLERHPFPGPALAIRCLCSEAGYPLERTAEGWIVPVHSVGVQGDSRSYRPVIAIEGSQPMALYATATELINRLTRVNRVMAAVRSAVALDRMRVTASVLSRKRLERLRRADAVVRRLSHESGFDRRIWQFPVVLIPLGTSERPDSVVLRPVDSVDGMTAQSAPMEAGLLEAMARELAALDGVCGVFYDLTHKPPGTIEWE
ncbi:MAG: glutamine-hydrolyzing GMP synthase [Acidobacteria bacterium]|nr:glutamine-hydrolyzing GMP synthase [Acidobacteriota bacterium]